MVIQDLDYLASISCSSNLMGSAYATAGGYTAASYGTGSAGVYALGVGTITNTLGNTSVNASLYPTYAKTTSIGTASALAIDSYSTARASYYSNMTYTASMGGSMTVGFTTTTSSYRTY
ncbi:MAG: hypothetical protein B0A82_01205 [Alkalinema sp. CACIAM 70d]|nr:MAG: hypothetical protein B0A82_01205 [Alkalinema sp. CACIAM 70d]